MRNGGEYCIIIQRDINYNFYIKNSRTSNRAPNFYSYSNKGNRERYIRDKEFPFLISRFLFYFINFCFEIGLSTTRNPFF